MTDLLTGFLRTATRQAYEPGVWDCGLMCADWFHLRWGVDPAADWRGHYRSEIGLARLLKRRGGIVAHFNDCLTGAGATRTADPQRGDIAIVATAQGLTGGIVTGTNVVLCAPAGIISRHRDLAPTIAAWSV